MKTYDVVKDSGEVVAFEIPNVGRDRVQRLVEDIPGASILRRQPRFHFGPREEKFCEFTFDGATFFVYEPWSDSSRYYIGEYPPRPSSALDSLRKYFSRVPRFPLWSLLAQKLTPSSNEHSR